MDSGFDLHEYAIYIGFGLSAIDTATPTSRTTTSSQGVASSVF